MPKNYDSVYELSDKLDDYIGSLITDGYKKYNQAFRSDNEDDYSDYPKRRINRSEVILYILMEKIGKSEVEKIIFDSVKETFNCV